MTKIFHRITLTASLVLSLIACSASEMDENDMSYAKSATGTLISKAGLRVQMQDDFDGKAENFTAQFFVSNRLGYIAPSVPPNPIIPTPIAIGNITPVGEILWSIGGNTQRRLISIYDGVAITGVAEHFAINATDNTDPNDSSNPTQYDVTITCASGVRGSTSLPPIYQEYITNTNTGSIAFGNFILNGAEHLTVPIPKNAGVNSVMVTANYPGIVLTGSEFGFSQASTIAGILKEYNPMNYEFVPLSPQADTLLFKNFATSGGQIVDFSVTWGIDG
jgi:hypothetical protein